MSEEIKQAEQEYVAYLKIVHEVHVKEQELKMKLANAIIKESTIKFKKPIDCGIKRKRITLMELIKKGEGKIDDYVYVTSTGKELRIDIKFMIPKRVQQGIDENWYDGQGLPPANEMNTTRIKSDYSKAKMLYDAGWKMCGKYSFDEGLVNCHYRVCYSKQLYPESIYAIKKEQTQ